MSRHGGINFGCAAVIECSDQPLDLSFHPKVSTLVAAALVDGTVEVHDYSALIESPIAASMPKQNNDDDEGDDDTIVSSTQVHHTTTNSLLDSSSLHKQITSASCRAIQFSNDGSTLWTGGSDGHIVALDTKQICTFGTPPSSSQSIFRYRVPNAGYKNAPIQVLYEIPDRHLLASGDDIGCVRLWDQRLMDHHDNVNNTAHLFSPTAEKSILRGCVADWKVHDDYISAIQHMTTGTTGGETAHQDSSHALLSTSADGTLAIYDMRMTSSSSCNNNNNHHHPSSTQEQPQSKSLPNGVIRQSDPQDDELLSLCIIKDGKKVICGTTEGVLSIFSYGTWGDVSDRYPGHPSSIDAILKIDEDTILTGSSDGLIRVISIQPNQLLGILGDNHEGFPIEQLQFTCNKSYVGSITHDSYIRLWDARILDENNICDDDDDDNAIDDDDRDVKMAAVPIKSDNGPTEAMNTNSDDEWEDMDEDDDSDDDESDEDDDDDDDDDDHIHSGGDRKMSNRKKGSTRNSQRANRLKSERERFFDDL
jgi:WD repeat-containing protein 55